MIPKTAFSTTAEWHAFAFGVLGGILLNLFFKSNERHFRDLRKESAYVAGGMVIGYLLERFNAN